MSHPQPPFGPQDPNQQPPEPPTQAFPTAPMPPVPNNPYAPQPPVSGAPQPPTSGAPYPPQQPTSGTPYPPQQPTPGDPYAAQPPTSGAPYPPPAAPGGGYPPAPGAWYPPATGPYPPTPGQPFGAPPAKKSNKGLWIGLGVGALVLLLLCCGGGIFAIYSGAKKTQDAIDSLPTPGITSGPFDDTPAPGESQSTPEAGQTDGETFNMAPGDTLIINDDDGTIEITLSNFRTKNDSCQQFMPGPKKGMFLIADVTAEVTKGTGSVNPFYFRWKGADGSEESGISGAFSGCGKLLNSGNDLPVGTKRTGQLVLDVKDKNGVVEYQHNFRPAGSWKP